MENANKIELEDQQNLSEKDVKELNDEWRTFSQTLDNNKITQKTKDYLVEKGKTLLESRQTNIDLLAQLTQNTANSVLDQQKMTELLQQQTELIQQNMQLQAQLAQMQAQYNQQIEENQKLFRENNELRFPRAYGKLRDVGTQTDINNGEVQINGQSQSNSLSK